MMLSWISDLCYSGSPLKNENLYQVRLLEFVGSGRTSVSHARTLAETYDSDIVRCHGLNMLRKHGLNKYFSEFQDFHARIVIWKRTKSLQSSLKLEYWKNESTSRQLSSQRERGLHERALHAGMALPVEATFVNLPLKKSSDDDTVVIESWPMLLPYSFVSC